MTDGEFKGVKGPDFLSRLRATLDIPSINLPVAAEPEPEKQSDPASRLVQPPGTFNPYGPTEDFPCVPSILLRRAGILALNLKKTAPMLERANGSLDVDPSILRALLLLPEFNHGNRSFEAILDMSHLADAEHFAPALLPAATQLSLHANAEHFSRLPSVDSLSKDEREQLGRVVHRNYVSQRKADPKHDPNDREQAAKWAEKLGMEGERL